MPPNEEYEGLDIKMSLYDTEMRGWKPFLRAGLKCKCKYCKKTTRWSVRFKDFGYPMFRLLLLLGLLAVIFIFLIFPESFAWPILFAPVLIYFLYACFKIVRIRKIPKDYPPVFGNVPDDIKREIKRLSLYKEVNIDEMAIMAIIAIFQS